MIVPLSRRGKVEQSVLEYASRMAIRLMSDWLLVMAVLATWSGDRFRSCRAHKKALDGESGEAYLDDVDRCGQCSPQIAWNSI
jgi:hypothetical protein